MDDGWEPNFFQHEPLQRSSYIINAVTPKEWKGLRFPLRGAVRQGGEEKQVVLLQDCNAK